MQYDRKEHALPDHDFEGQFTPEEHLRGDLYNLSIGWQEVGVDPNDFLKCGKCHKWIRDLVDREDVTTKDGEFLPGIPDEACCSCD